MIKSLAWVAASVFVGGGTVAAITVSHNAGANATTHPVVNAGQRPVNKQGHHPRFGAWGMPGGLNVTDILANDVASALHVSPATVESELNSGQSLAQIAQHAGVSRASLKAVLLQDAQTEIQKAVSAGLFTASQAERLDSHLSPLLNRVMMQNPAQWRQLIARQGGQVMMGMFFNDVGSALHISAATVQTDMKSGQSLAEIAQHSGSSASALESALVQDARTQIQKGVSIGIFTSAQASRLDSHIGAVIDRVVTQSPGRWRHFAGFQSPRGFMGPLLQKTAAALHISPSTLGTDLSSGETLSQIAQHAGTSTSALESTLMKDAQAQIQKAVSNGLLTPAQGTRIKSHLSVMIDHWVTGNWSHKTSMASPMPGLPTA